MTKNRVSISGAALKAAVFVLAAVICVPVFPSSTAAALPPVIITEVAVDETGGKDWVELYVTQDGVNLNGYSLRVNDSVRDAAGNIVTFSTAAVPSGFGGAVFNKGTYIVVEIGRSSAAYEKRNDSYYIVSTTFSTSGTEGIRGTEGVLQLYSASSQLADVLIWTSGDNSALNSRVSAAYTAVAAIDDSASGTKHWSPSEAVPANCAFFRTKAGTSEPGTSLARRADINADPVDTNTKNDWNKLRRPTMGYGYEKIDIPSARVSVTGANPFSPYEGAGKTTVSFNLGTSTGAIKTMRVFDVKGRERAVLIKQDIPYCDVNIYGRDLTDIPVGEIDWAGRDSSGSVLPTGIYIIHLEAYCPVTGRMMSGKTTAAIGMKR